MIKGWSQVTPYRWEIGGGSKAVEFDPEKRTFITEHDGGTVIIPPDVFKRLLYDVGMDLYSIAYIESCREAVQDLVAQLEEKSRRTREVEGYNAKKKQECKEILAIFKIKEKEVEELTRDVNRALEMVGTKSARVLELDAEVKKLKEQKDRVFEVANAEIRRLTAELAAAKEAK